MSGDLNGQDFSLTGMAVIDGSGNELANVLAGNTLGRGAGNDTYLFGLGAGSDTVQENDVTAGNLDLVQFMGGTRPDEIWFRQLGNDLEVCIIGTTDKLTMQDWYLGDAHHVEQFKTSDGKTLLDSKVQELVNAMASFTPLAAGQTTLPTNCQTTLLPIIASDWGP